MFQTLDMKKKGYDPEHGYVYPNFFGMVYEFEDLPSDLWPELEQAAKNSMWWDIYH